MWKIFSGKNSKNKKAKISVTKSLFGASTQKKAIMTAARESAQDQKNLIKKYNELVRLREVTHR